VEENIQKPLEQMAGTDGQPQPAFSPPANSNGTAGTELPVGGAVTSPGAPPPQPKTKKKLFISILVALIVIAGSAAAYWHFHGNKKTPVSQARMVNVGVLEPLSGDNISTGNDRKRAIELAKKDLNLQGINIRLFYQDSNCAADTAVKGIDTLINTNHVVAVIGDDCSTSTLAAAKVAEAAHVVLISPAATSPAITQAGNYIFRTVPSDSQQGVFTANLMYGKGVRSIGIIHEDGAYGVGLADAFSAAFKAKGGVVADSQEFPEASLGVTAQLQHLKASKPGAIYIISGDSNSDTAILLKIKELGFQVPLYGSEALKLNSFISDAGDAASGLIITALTDGTSAFKDEYHVEYNLDAGDYTAQTYDAYKSLALVIKNGANTGQQIKDALYKLQFSGATGSVKFDTNGDISGNYEIVVVQDKHFVSVPQ
jgi:branched-chain amino acid transport system substrate-binding protein